MGSVLAIAVCLAGVGMASAGVLREVITFDDQGQERSVVILLPEHYEKGNDLLPLVLHLHGASPTFLPGNPAERELGSSGYRDIPSKFNVIVAAPSALAHPLFPFYQWNFTEACCALPDSAVPDDVGFLDRLLDALLLNYPVDPQRVYLYGYSDGAAMAYRLACDHTGRFAALVSGAGQFPVQDPGRCAPSAPIAVLEVHSLDDEAIPFDGGTFPLNEELTFPGSIDLIQYWADHNGCVGTLQFGEEPTIDLTFLVEGKETTINTFTQCPHGLDVELWSMEGVPHLPLFFRVGPNGMKTLAEKSWKFLRSHKR
jgi:polyhydroxybutyrate depolymerase